MVGDLRVDVAKLQAYSLEHKEDRERIWDSFGGLEEKHSTLAEKVQDLVVFKAQVAAYATVGSVIGGAAVALGTWLLDRLTKSG